MDRRAFVAGAVALLTTPLAAGAQQAGAPSRIAIVLGVSPLATMLGPDPAHPYVRAIIRACAISGTSKGRTSPSSGDHSRVGTIAHRKYSRTCSGSMSG